MPASPNPDGWMKLWGMPLLMGIITLVGLLLAIMGTDRWLHAFSWAALAVPLFVMVKYGVRFFRSRS